MNVPPSPVFLKAQGLLIIWCVFIFYGQNPSHFFETILFHPVVVAMHEKQQVVPDDRWCGSPFPGGRGRERASERASRQTAARSPLACASLSEALTPDARKALSFQHHKLRLRREDSWPSSSSSNWLESALTPQECSAVSRHLFLL